MNYITKRPTRESLHELQFLAGNFGRHDWASDDTQDRMTGAPSRSQADRKATGRAALTYLFDNGLAPYISYSTFFLPAIGVNTNGQAFKPETGRQYEVGINIKSPRPAPS